MIAASSKWSLNENQSLVWHGDYEIRQENDLDRIKGYHVITGSLVISSSSLLHLEGLESLAYVVGDVFIGNNTLLTSLKGLNNLTFIGGDLHITANVSLKDLSALSNISCFGGVEMRIIDNERLTRSRAEILRYRLAAHGFDGEVCIDCDDRR